MHDLRTDGWAQRAGIDRLIVLDSGKTLNIDEKVRDRDYGDFCAEYWSDFERRTPGWIAKDSATDFIAYAVLPTQTCVLVPFQPLRLAWRKNRVSWVRKYQRIEADNGGYVTVSVGIPFSVLHAAIADCLTVRWSDESQAAAE
jgi:hypothetical protein